MHLKRLEIKGFKSFADHTELSFNPGINIIVGPNGCGKSNIVDAIRWVLGEANIRHLRGHKNEDIIFNGTDKKRALGMAQVEMTVDNLEGKLPLEYSEVTMSRKIFRSGESEFYLNKSKVRLKDIVKLYTDTGLGKNGYSIISQGELERVLNGQPIDRRLMLEEAAGTMKYRQQRDEVKQRITATAQDLLRLEDILGELRHRKTDLFAKAERAQTYIAMRDEYNNLEKQVLAYRLKELSDNLAACDAELTSKHAAQKAIATSLENLNNSLQQAQSLQNRQRANLDQLRDEQHELESELNRMGAEIKLSEERIRNHRERIQAAHHDSKKFADSLEKLEKDMELKIADYNKENAYYQDRQKQVEILLHEITKAKNSLDEQENILQSHSHSIYERAAEEANLKNKITGWEQKIKKTQEKKERLLIRIEESDGQLKTAEKSWLDLQTQKEKHLTAQHKWAQAIAQAEVQRRKQRDLRMDVEHEFKDISSQQLKTKNKLLTLKELRQSYAGYSEGVKSLLKLYRRGETSLQGIKGPVSDLIEVPSGLELAISVGLGKGMENIVVSSSESARQAVQLLKERRWGRVTFLPLDVLRVQNMPAQVKQEIIAENGVLGLAANLITYDSQYDKAIKYLLGRVLLVQDLDCGLRVFKKFSYPLRIVTLEGEIINTSGAMTGGNSQGSKSNLLQRRQEEKSISQSLIILQQAETENRARATELDNQLITLDNRLSQGKNGQAEVEFQLKIIRDEETRVQKLLEKLKLDGETNHQEIYQLEEYARRADEERQGLLDSHKDYRSEYNTIAKEMEVLKTNLERNRRDYEVMKERYSSHQEQLSMKKRELESTASNMAQFEQVRNSYRQSVQEADDLLERLQKEVAIYTERVILTTEKIKEKQSQLQAIIKSLSISRQEQEDMNNNIETINADIQQHQQQAAVAQDQIRILEMKVVRLDTELQGMFTQWQQKFPGEDNRDHYTPLASRQIRGCQTRIGELRTNIELLGSIDMDSIKEYDEIKARYDFLQQQNDDLLAAKDALEKLLQETGNIMAQNFTQFMELANESFRKTFVEIFNGGDASLNIESVSNLSAGVDIVIKMPGKRSQSLNLLSGGERALTCIAFIFSLLKLKPAPFCLLDEIDAALDEINLLRFNDFLRHMAQDTQFIVITHRQATVEAGTNIYGITMPQEGISSVLSIQCEDAQSLAV